MKPIQAHRQSPDGVLAAKRARRTKAAAPVEYPDGYFCELISKHNWPPRFESVGRWTSARHAAPHVISAQSRSGSGHAAHPLGLPGAKQHITQWEARKALEVAK